MHNLSYALKPEYSIFVAKWEYFMSYQNRFNYPTKEESFSLTAIVVLDKIIKKNRCFSTLLEGDDVYLEELLDFLVDKDILQLQLDEGQYTVTAKGQNLYKNFRERYRDYLRIFDVFCAVDLDQGVFGFEKIFDYSDDIFIDYINEDRFVDLRVTVCEFKNMQQINVFEIIFISFLMEKRFREPRDRSNVMGLESWQYQCSSGSIFTEIVAICNASPHYDELGYEDEQGRVSGKEVIADVIEQGTQLSMKIAQQRMNEDREKDQNSSNNDPEVIETHYQTEYYAPYYDPYYHSPLWDLALIGLILL